MTAASTIKDDAVRASVDYCRSVTRRASTNFMLPFRTLPGRKRRAFEIVYAFMRICDDLSDDKGTGRADRFRAWRKQVDAAFDGDTSGHPVLPALMEVVAEFRIPRKPFIATIDGTEQDLHVTRFSTFDDLYPYCYKVASAVGLVSVRIFGVPNDTPATWSRIEDLAESCGIAFQLTNILRDVREDLERDRVYLPQEDLERFGLTEDDFHAHVLDDRFLAFMRFQVERAESYYAKSAALMDEIESDARPCLATMRGVYHGLLDRIVRQNYDVWSHRARLSLPRKLGVVARAMMTRFSR